MERKIKMYRRNGNDKGEVEARMENYPYLFVEYEKTQFTALPQNVAPTIWMKLNPVNDC